MTKVNRQNINDRELSSGENLLLWLVPMLVSWLQRFLGMSLRRIDIGKENVTSLEESNQPWIFSIWHTNVFFSTYLLRNNGAYVLISASRDGEIIHRVVKSFGNDSVRGSTGKSGITALKQLIKKLKEGHSAAITPDGPKGPAFEVQEGILTAAARSGCPIVPFHYEGVRQWVFQKAWDKHRIPKPFSTIVVSWGEPIMVPGNLDTEERDQMVMRIQKAMDENMAKCQKKVKELTGG